jgi:hypothetical protein
MLPVHRNASLGKLEQTLENRHNPSDEVATSILSNDLPTVLIIEDDPDIRTYLQILLEDRYHCLVAEEGE